MDRFLIEGGAKLRGDVQVMGAKNAALPILFATLLARGPCRIEGVPRLSDVDHTLLMLRELGATAEVVGERAVEIEVPDAGPVEASYDLVRKMRASFCVLGPLLARRKEARVSLPGGCVFGPRPVDIHLKGLAALGAQITQEHGYIVARAPRLIGAEIYLGGHFGSTVLGTCNVACAAVLAEGTTVIEGAALEPEVQDLCRFLVKLGARIEGIGTHRLVIEGVRELGGARHEIIPDRIEAGTFLIAGAMANSDIRVIGARLDHLAALVDVLRHMGLGVTHERDASGRESLSLASSRHLAPADVTTLPFPGFPTDLQAQLMALLTIADGISVVTEKVYPDRFMHISELNRLGAQIRKEGPAAIIQGTRRLSGAQVMASDLRASAALVLAALAAQGETEIQRVYHIDRGYERIEEKLRAVGARIRRVSG